jgi:hypothetical protein
LVYEFAVPFDDPGAPKLPPAKLTVTTAPDETGHYPLIPSATLASIEVELGKHRLHVPPTVLRDVGPLDLGTLDFFWVGLNYYVAISRKRPDQVTRPERIEFVFADGALKDVRFDYKSQRERYPKLFNAGSAATPSPSKPK